MKSIKLPILFNNETTSALSRAGVDYDLSDCDEKEMVFYSINALSPNPVDVGNYHMAEYTDIHCNGDVFLCPLTVQQVSEIIKEGL